MTLRKFHVADPAMAAAVAASCKAHFLYSVFESFEDNAARE